MKTAALLATLLALGAGCSASSSDRPTTQDEQRAEIEADQERVAAETRENTTDESRADADDDAEEALQGDARETDTNAPSTWAQADARRAGDAAEDRSEGETDGAARHEADNTGRNERDDEPGKLTALDQSNSASDVDITQAIRKKVVADDGLSFNAKNVKIITVSGKVTLRGPVESARESSSIEKSARAVPGVVAVDNQIEVKR